MLNHIANALVLASYLVHDILPLRVLAVLANGCFLALFLLQRPLSPSSIAWQSVFMAINIVQVWRLILERRPVRFSADEQQLFQLAFRPLAPRELRRFLQFAEWKSAAPGDRLVEEQQKLDAIFVLFSGEANVVAAGRPVAQLGPGRFIGEMSFLTGAPTSASVDAATALRYVRFPSGELRKLFARNPDLRAAWQMLIGHDLAAKLRTT